jgi:leucyl/phenylalanyl-tRNA--protein transferase
MDGLHISRSTRRSARRFTVTFDTAFTQVMSLCASTRTDGNWITADFVSAYTTLHLAGHATSVEVWDESEEIVGGAYGVRIDRFFAGESMFHLRTDASKVALFHLVGRLRDENVALFDTQWCTPHLASLGCVEVPRADYLQLLHRAVD